MVVGTDASDMKFPGGKLVNPIPRHQENVDYDLALVAFLDILGRKEHILASQQDDDLLRRMVRALEEAGYPIVYPPGNVPSLRRGDVTMSIFSDSIIISRNMSVGDYLGDVFFWQSIDKIGKTLLRHGFFLRGGITMGPMYHTGQIAVGPALIRAIQLEERAAIYPRVRF